MLAIALADLSRNMPRLEYFNFFYSHEWVKAPSTNIQHPEKLQIPSSNIHQTRF